jgi:PPM family protein phosphatase
MTALGSRGARSHKSLAVPHFMRINYAAKTDVGMKRDNNEDNFLVYPEQNVFAVFDGMGGHAAGEVASAIAANEVKDFFTYTGKDEDATWPFKGERDRNYDENRTLTAIKLANQRIIEQSEQDGAKKNMGTTAVMVHFVERNGSGPKAVVAHVGDSRVYLFRGGRLQRVTIDHSLVEEYLRLGKITAEEAKNFPQKNIILRALGQQKVVDVEVNELAPEPGDVFLLCSDGLSGMVTDDIMQAILQKANGLDAAAKKLIDTANANGGIDNVTVILAQYLPN